MYTIFKFQKYLTDGDCGWAGLSWMVNAWLLRKKETPVKTE